MHGLFNPLPTRNYPVRFEGYDLSPIGIFIPDKAPLYFEMRQRYTFHKKSDSPIHESFIELANLSKNLMCRFEEFTGSKCLNLHFEEPLNGENNVPF